MRVGEIMITRVVSIQMDDRLDLVKEIFEKAGFHHLMVMDGEQLVGIITKSDAYQEISPFVGQASERGQDRETLKRRAHQIMTRNPLTVTPKTTVAEASNLLLERNISCLPVVDHAKLVGVVTWKDLMEALLSERLYR